MQRPATIACRRCGETVTVRGRGPVPTYCAGCRSKPKVRSGPRPASIECRLCGSPVEVKSRGPLPKQCRGKCQKPLRVATERPNSRKTTKDVVPRELHHPAKPRTQPRLKRSSREPVVSTTVETRPQITRLDVAAVAQRLATPNYGFYARLSRMRRILSIGLWLLVIVAVVLIFLVGSQPAPPESLAR